MGREPTLYAIQCCASNDFLTQIYFIYINLLYIHLCILQCNQAVYKGFKFKHMLKCKILAALDIILLYGTPTTSNIFIVTIFFTALYTHIYAYAYVRA